MASVLALAIGCLFLGVRIYSADSAWGSAAFYGQLLSAALLLVAYGVWSDRLRKIGMIAKGLHIPFFGLLFSAVLLYSPAPQTDSLLVLFGLPVFWALTSTQSLLDKPLSTFGFGLWLGLGMWIDPMVSLLLLHLWFGMLFGGVSNPKSYLSAVFGLVLSLWLGYGVCSMAGIDLSWERFGIRWSVHEAVRPEDRFRLLTLILFLPFGVLMLREMILVRRRAGVFKRKVFGVLFGLGLLSVAMGFAFRTHSVAWALLSGLPLSALLGNHFVHLKSRMWQDAVLLYALLAAFLIELIR